MVSRVVGGEKSKIIQKALEIMRSRNRIDAVELARELGVPFEEFKMYYVAQLVSIARQRGCRVVYGTYDPETGAVTDRIVTGNGKIIVPIFIHPSNREASS